MKHPLFVAINAGLLWLVVSGVAHDAPAAQWPLVVRVTTDRDDSAAETTPLDFVARLP
jgi:hypothetical protein